MRFLLIIKATEYSEAGLAEGKDYHEAMISYKKSLAKKGTLLADEELQPSSTGLRITYQKNDGKPQVLAGPFPLNQDQYLEKNLKKFFPLSISPMYIRRIYRRTN